VGPARRRILLQTHDDARIYVTYHGVLELNASVQKALGEGGATRWEDQYFRVTPRLETGDERYGWVNRAVFVAEGRIHPVGVQYRVYRVT
jgi:hypothetical protein